MMIKSKLILFMMVLFIVLSVCTLPIYANDVDESVGSPQSTSNSGTKYIKMKNKLQALNFYRETSDNVFQPNENVTRAQFVYNVVYLLYGDSLNTEMKEQSVFHDVPNGSWAASHIAAASRIGLVSVQDNRFYPEREISFNEAVKIIVTALGYGKFADETGGYPAGYLQIASQLKLIGANISATDGNITHNTMIHMLFNALKVNIAENIIDNQGNIRVNTPNNNSLLDKRGYYEGKGIINVTPSFNLDGSNAVTTKGHVKLDNEIYISENSPAEDYFGYAVNFYYVQNDMSEYKEIMYMEIDEKNTNIVSLESENILSGNGEFYRYQLNNDAKAEKVNIDRSATILYNGYILKTYTDFHFMPKRGHVELIDHNGDGNSDVVIIEAFEEIVVDNISNDIITDKLNPQYSLDLSDTSIEYEITDNTGLKVALEDIYEWNVLRVFFCENPINNKEKYKIIVNKLTDKGKILNISDTDTENIKLIEFEVDDRGFYTKKLYNAKDMNEEVVQSLKIGQTIEFCLNIDNQIVMLKDISGEIKYGYLMAVQKELFGEAQVKIFTQEGAFQIYNLRDSIIYNETNTQSRVVVNDLVDKKSLIRYKTNNVNKITFIDTPQRSENEQDGGLTKGPSGKNALFKKTSYSFAGIFNISADSYIFTVPEDITDEKAFNVRKGSSLVNDVRYDVVAYYDSENEVVSNCVQIEVNETTKNRYGNSDYAEYVYKITRAANEEGGGYNLYTYVNNSEYVSFVSSEADFEKQDIQVGDIVRAKRNEKREIYAISKVYDYSEDKIISGASTDFNAEFRLVSGNIVTKKDNIIKFSSNAHYFSLEGAPVYIYRKDSKDVYTIERATYTNIMAKTDSYAGDKAVVYSRWGKVMSICVYE